MPSPRAMEPPTVVKSALLAKVKIDSLAANDVCRVPLVRSFGIILYYHGAFVGFCFANEASTWNQ